MWKALFFFFSFWVCLIDFIHTKNYLRFCGIFDFGCDDFWLLDRKKGKMISMSILLAMGFLMSDMNCYTQVFYFLCFFCDSKRQRILHTILYFQTTNVMLNSTQILIYSITVIGDNCYFRKWCLNLYSIYWLMISNERAYLNEIVHLKKIWVFFF